MLQIKSRDLIAEVSKELEEVNIDSPIIDTEALIANWLNISVSALKLKIALNESITATAQQYVNLKTNVKRRVSHEPLQHILGTAPFGDLELTVGLGVFIPRPETEILADDCVRATKLFTKRLRIADLCSGSGAIGIYVATHSHNVDMTLVEKSPEAYAYLLQNVARYQARAKELCNTITPVLADAPTWKPTEKLDIIVSNPPYVPPNTEMSEEVMHDPDLALYGGGNDGFDFPQRLISHASTILKQGGELAIEHFDTQAQKAAKTMEECGFQNIRHQNDLNEIKRFTIGNFEPKI